MRRLLLTSLLVGIIIFILAAPVPAWAQGGWTLDADFTSGALPYFLTFGNANPCGTAQSNYIDTAGVHSVLSDCFGGEFRVRLEFNFGVNTHVTRIDMYISGECHPKFRYLFTSATGNLLLTDQGSGHWLWTGDTFMSDGTGQGIFESQEAPADSSPPGCNITWTSLHLEGYSAAPATYTPGFTPTSTQAPTPTSTPTPTPIPPAPCGAIWTQTYDFQQGTQSWTGPAGESGTQDGDGFHAEDAIDGSNPWWAKHLIITRNIGATGTSVTSIDLDIDYTAGPAGDPDLRKIQVLGPDESPLINLTSAPTGGHATWTGTAGPGNYSIVVYVSGGMPGTPIGGNAVVHRITFEGTGGDPTGACRPVNANPDNISWAYPIASPDTLATDAYISMSTDSALNSYGVPFYYLKASIPSGTYDHSRSSFITYSTHPDAWVHSSTDGTVSSVVALVDGTNPCEANPKDLFRPNYSCIFDQGTNPRALDYHDAFRVTIEQGSNDISYLVASPQVIEGQTVKAGCLIGKTLKFSIYVPPSSFTPFEAGYTIVQGRAGGLPFDVVPYLQVEPANIKCPENGSGGGGGGCKLVRDAAFLNLGDGNWTSTESLLSPNGASQGLWLKSSPVRQTLPLLPDESYSIDVVAHLITPVDAGVDIDFTIQLGNGDPIRVPVSSTIPQETQIASTVYPPSPSGNFDLVIAPTDNSRLNVAVDFICVNDTVNDPVLPSECIIVNPNFSDNSGWATTGTVNFLPGLVEIVDGGNIHQDVTLSPKQSGAQTYKLTIEARRKGAAQSGHSVSIDWSVSGTPGSSSGTFGPFVDQLSWQTKTDTLNISEKAVFTLTLAATSDPAGDTAQIQRVCVTTDDGSPPPGYQPPPPIPFTASCRVCSYAPVGDVNVDLSEVIGWLFCALSQIWHCQAKTILMGIWQAIVNLLTLIGFIRLWLSYTFDALMTAINGDIRVIATWLNGQLTNLAARIANALLGISPPPTGGSGISLFDILKLLIEKLAGLISQLIDAIKGLALALIGLILSVITMIVNLLLTAINQLFGFLRSLLGVITSAANAPPVVPAGLPACDPNAQEITELCLPIFIIDNTVLADGSPWWTLVTISEGIGAFALLWWALNRFRTALNGGDD